MGNKISNNIEDKLRCGLRDLNEVLSEDKIEKLIVLIEELERWNQKFNLTAIRSIEDMVSGHLLDSLSVRPFLHGQLIIDVGTGAGFPGLPLAVVDPDLDFILLDSNGKKVGFIKHVINLLDINNAQAIKKRAEDYVPASGFDTVIARALTDIPNLIALTEHLLVKQGMIISLKGKNPIKELKKIPKFWKYSVSKVIVPGLEKHERHIISLQNLKNEIT